MTPWVASSAASPRIAAYADPPPSPPQLGSTELSSATEGTLWPVPTFEDGCQSQEAQSINPIGNSSTRTCNPDILVAQPQLADWRAALKIAGAATRVQLVGGSAVSGWLLLSRRRAGKRPQSRSDSQMANRGTEALVRTASAGMAFEMDPQAVLYTRPLLADVTESLPPPPSTAPTTRPNSQRTPVIPSDEDAITAFVAAAKRPSVRSKSPTPTPAARRGAATCTGTQSEHPGRPPSQSCTMKDGREGSTATGLYYLLATIR